MTKMTDTGNHQILYFQEEVSASTFDRNYAKNPQNHKRFCQNNLYRTLTEAKIQEVKFRCFFYQLF
mgnify:CR=1 FL=1